MIANYVKEKSCKKYLFIKFSICECKLKLGLKTDIKVRIHHIVIGLSVMGNSRNWA